MNDYAASIIVAWNWFDWSLVTITTLHSIYGLFRGFVREAVTATAWVLAAWIAYMYTSDLAVYLQPHIAVNSMRIALTVVAVFAAVLIASSILRGALLWLISHAGLASLDYVLGLFFGVARGVVISMLIVIGTQYIGLNQDPWWQSSSMVEKLLVMMDKIPEHLSPEAKKAYGRLRGSVS